MIFVTLLLVVLSSILMFLAVALFIAIDDLLDHTISDFMKNMFDTGSKIIKTILDKK